MQALLCMVWYYYPTVTSLLYLLSSSKLSPLLKELEAFTVDSSWKTSDYEFLSALVPNTVTSAIYGCENSWSGNGEYQIQN